MSNSTTPELSDEQVAEIEVQLAAADPGGEVSVDTLKLISMFEANQREYVRALCQTVRAAWTERAKAMQLLSPDIPRTDLCDAARQIVFAHALEKGNAEKLQEKNTALREQLAEARADNERLALVVQGIEEREAAVCPEDVGFDGYIRTLQSRLAQVEKERDSLRDSASIVAFQAHQIDGNVASSLIERGAAQQRESDAKLVESYHEYPSTNDYSVAAAIRANHNASPRRKGEEG